MTDATPTTHTALPLSQPSMLALLLQQWLLLLAGHLQRAYSVDSCCNLIAPRTGQVSEQ